MDNDFIPLNSPEKAPEKRIPKRPREEDSETIEIAHLSYDHYILTRKFEKASEMTINKLNELFGVLETLSKRLDKIERAIPPPPNPYIEMANFLCKKYNYQFERLIKTVNELNALGQMNRFKRALCHNKPNCPYYDACRFAHSVEEIKDMDEKAWEKKVEPYYPQAYYPQTHNYYHHH